MDRRDIASEEEEEYDSAEEEGSFTQSENEAEDAQDAGELASAESGTSAASAGALAVSKTHLTEERGPEDKAGEELQPSPEADGEAAAEDAEGVEDDDADLEGALESVAEGMQALNVDDEVISQAGEEDPEDGQLVPGAEDEETQPAGQPEQQSQPYDVPTKGAFWLHDDRYGGGDGGRRPVRRKKLWDPTDDPWKHDMYEQLESGRPDRYQEPRRGSDRRGRRGSGRAASRDYSRNGNIRAANVANASARAAAPDDDIPPGYEQPRYRPSNASRWPEEQEAAEAPAAASRSGGGGWWESGPAAAEPAPASSRGRGRGQGRAASKPSPARQAAPNREWATEDVQPGTSEWTEATPAAVAPSTYRRGPQGSQHSAAASSQPAKPKPRDAASAAPTIGNGFLTVNGGEPARPDSTGPMRALNAGALDFQPPAAGPALQAAPAPLGVLQPQPAASGAATPAGAVQQMVFLQAPAGMQQGMQYQYVMPASSGVPSQPGLPGGAWVQMAGGTPMSTGFQMVPAEVFGSGAQQAFVPGPMMMGMGYPMGMRPAMVKPVRRPITIQAPPDAQAAAGADHEGQALNANTTNAPARTGGRRYSAMTGRLAEDPSAASVAANA